MRWISVFHWNISSIIYSLTEAEIIRKVQTCNSNIKSKNFVKLYIKRIQIQGAVWTKIIDVIKSFVDKYPSVSSRSLQNPKHLLTQVFVGEINFVETVLYHVILKHVISNTVSKISILYLLLNLYLVFLISRANI